MKSLINNTFILWSVVALSLVLQSCGGGGSGVSGPSGGTGTLELGLTDAANKDYQAIYVTIAEVQVNKQNEENGEAGWETIMRPEQTYNLLDLVNGVTAVLGVGELDAGRYGQMRLVLGQIPETPEMNILGVSHSYANYLIDGENNAIELKVPSGYQTGIKIVKGFTIEPSQATELILDFDAAKSVVKAGNSGKWLLKPTIKVLETMDMENSVSGVVDDGAAPIAGALVSAQVYDPGALDARDEVIVESTTMTTDAGYYKIYLPRDLYNIVATKDGYLPGCKEVDAQYFEEYIADFSLTAETGTVTISGTLSGLATEEDTAMLSIRQSDVDCGGPENAVIEVASQNVANGSYSIVLPAGSYDLVVSAAGKITRVEEGINTDTELNIALLPVE